MTAPGSSRVTVLGGEGDSVLAAFTSAGKDPGRVGDGARTLGRSARGIRRGCA